MPTYGHEFRALLALALPSMLSTFCFFAISITELSIMGHLGVDQLAAVSYAQMSMDFSTLVFMQGFNAGMNALCSQAFGAKNYHLLGQYGQLTATVLTIMCVPMALLWWNLGELLVLVGVKEQVAEYARVYCRLWILGMWPRSMFQVLSIFYQAQQIVLPTTAINGVTVLVNLFFATGFTYGTFGLPHLGFIGCPLGTALALWLRLLGYYYYMHVFKKYDRKCRWTWTRKGMDIKALKMLMAVGFPLAAGNLFENAQLQTMALFSAKIGEVQLGTHNSMMEFFFFATSPIYGLIGGSVTRSGAHLGAGKGHLARMVAQIAGLCIAVLSVVNGTIMVVFDGQIGRIFSNDSGVIDNFRQIAALGAFAYATLAFFYWSMIVLQSQARPLPLMTGFAVGAWLVGVPSAYFLGVWHDRRNFEGVWIGMLLGYVVTSSIGFGAAFFGTDWDVQAKLAVERSRKKKLQQTRHARNDRAHETDPLLP